MKKLFISFLLLSTPAFALKEYYGLSRSIRALGMGGAFYGLSDDEYALFYNPAGLSLYRTGNQGMLSINAQAAPDLLSAIKTVLDTTKGSNNVSTIVDQLQKYQGSPLYFNTGLFPHFVTKHFGVGLLIADTKLDFALLGKDLDTSVDITAISDAGLLVGWADSWLDDMLHIGVTLKGIGRGGGKKTFSLVDIAQKDSFKLDAKELGGTGVGVDFDLGGTYEIPQHLMPFGILTRASLVINNMLASDLPWARVGGRPPGLPRMLTLAGHTVFDGWEWFDNFHVLVDFAEFKLWGESDPDFGARGGSFWKHVNIGVEAPMRGWFVPRLGIHQGYWTLGLGINLRAARFEFATYTEEVSSTPGRLPSRRYALKFSLGWGAAGPDPIPATKAVAPREEPPKPAEKAPDGKALEELPPAEKKPAAPPGVPEENRKPQLLEPERDQREIPKTEGDEKDRFGLDQQQEEVPSGPARTPNSTRTLPKTEGSSGDRFGVDNPGEEVPKAP